MFMSSPSTQDTKLNIRQLAELAILAALTFSGKVALSFIPNVHPVALMLMAMTVVYGAKAFYGVAVYVALELICYGFGIWSISYIYVWPLLAAMTLLTASEGSRLVWAAIAALHGFLFGAFCSIPYFISGGWSYGISYWVAGIPYDLIHGVSNAVIVFFLIEPVIKIIRKVRNSFQ